MEKYCFLEESGTFRIKNPDRISGMYFPAAGEGGLKSCLTPTLGGDSKLDQNTFLLEPVSIENLHNNKSGRNFWCNVKGKGIWSAAGASAEASMAKFGQKQKENEQEECELLGGFMWQTVCRRSEKYRLSSEITSFVDIRENLELMYVKIRNFDDVPVAIIPAAVYPVYGRSADNIRDHRHVTSLLHRIYTTEYGMTVTPTLSFDERGHKINELTYFVQGWDQKGGKPERFYPTAAEFIGEGGDYSWPKAVVECRCGMEPGASEAESRCGVGAGVSVEGMEAAGGIRFAEITLQPGEEAGYIIQAGITKEAEKLPEYREEYADSVRIEEKLKEVKRYWRSKVNVQYKSGDKEADRFMDWVSFQPVLRRIYGCSFLPHHDYGRGGRGWRDLWQDCLALLLMNPSGVREMLLDNFGGVRMDGTNATIIGAGSGEFVADRNNITRVWMDHGAWPYLTTRLYIDQTGDFDLLEQQTTYFKDKQTVRGTKTDRDWNEDYGEKQKTAEGEIYRGTVLEHLLLENMCAFYEAGEHGHCRLRGADWNDALDMAAERGESVAFTNLYAGNLHGLGELLLEMKQRGTDQIEVAEEMMLLFEATEEVYDSAEARRDTLDAYLNKCFHEISGRKVWIKTEWAAEKLEEMAQWIFSHIRTGEWIRDSEGRGWFNSYYDNHGNPVEGEHEKGVRMMLTGQVFSIMAGTATEEQTAEIVKSADHYLYREEIGGYRLNTDFGEVKTDLGRMFGFAYGEKENGAVFSHMAVMFGNALYQRGFAEEGYKALNALKRQSLNFEKSCIYPGIPEYFNSRGRGMYHYLTGAASWYMLTAVTQMYGVRGQFGDLLLEPKLVAEQFDENKEAGIRLDFAGTSFEIIYRNPQNLSYSDYRITGWNREESGLTGSIINDGKALLIFMQKPKKGKLVILLGKPQK